MTAAKSADSMFIPVIFIIFFATHAMAWLMSLCSKKQDGDDGDICYVNPYRIVPRKEHENYIRYERQMYLDSLR
jgi:hypothetical protein